MYIFTKQNNSNYNTHSIMDNQTHKQDTTQNQHRTKQPQTTTTYTKHRRWTDKCHNTNTNTRRNNNTPHFPDNQNSPKHQIETNHATQNTRQYTTTTQRHKHNATNTHKHNNTYQTQHTKTTCKQHSTHTTNTNQHQIKHIINNYIKTNQRQHNNNNTHSIYINVSQTNRKQEEITKQTQHTTHRNHTKIEHTQIGINDRNPHITYNAMQTQSVKQHKQSETNQTHKTTLCKSKQTQHLQ